MLAVQPPSSNRYSEGSDAAPTIGPVIREAIDEADNWSLADGGIRS